MTPHPLSQPGVDEPVPLNAIPPEGMEQNGVRVFDDGSAVVQRPVPAPQPEVIPEENIARMMSAEELGRLGSHLREAVQQDKSTQDQFFNAVSDTLTILGIDAVQISRGGLPDGQDDSRGRNVNSSALFETLLDLTATVMSSIYPSKSPVSCQILGESSDDLDGAAIRKTAFFNAWLQYSDKGFEKELKRTVFWSILTGSIYVKVYVDAVLGRPTMRMIPLKNFVLNRSLSSHLAAARKTQIHQMSGKEYLIRKRNGEFLDVVIHKVDPDSETPVYQAALDDIEAKQQGSADLQEDKVYELYECHVDTIISGDRKNAKMGIPLPYIVILDAESGKVLKVTRNWDPEDPLRRRKESFVNFSFLPALDGEGYGLVQTSAAAAQVSSEILRELLVAGSYASTPSGFVVSMMQKRAANIRPKPGHFSVIESNLPISQCVAPLPFKEPSQTLFELKNQLEDSVRRPGAIVNHKVADMSPQAPMGSTLAIMESLQKIPNFILQGYHQAFSEVLTLLNECFYGWLPEGMRYPFKAPGTASVMMRDDFAPHLQVIPSSDPAMQNSAYRLMRAEMILTNALKAPQMHNMRAVEKLYYKSLQVPEEQIEEILVPDQQAAPPPPALDPVSENSQILASKPVKAYLPQDHEAHIAVHKALMGMPDVANNGAMAGAIQAHVYEHMAMQMQIQLSQQAGINLPADPTQLPVEAQNQIAVAAAQVFQQQQQQQAQQPAPDMLNAQAAIMMAEAEKEMVQVRGRQAELESQAKQQQLELDFKKLELESIKVQSDREMKAQKLELDENVARGKDARDSAKTELDLEKGHADLLEKSLRAAHLAQGPDQALE